MTTIGIIGGGHVGSSLAKAAIAHGYDVVLSNSQGPDSLAGLVSDLGPKASAAKPEQAAAAGDFAIVAIPITTVSQVPPDPLAGKVVIATINYFPRRDGPIAAIDDGTTTAPGVLQAHLPASQVVRAFSMLVAALYDEFGFDALDLGGLDESWRVDPGQPAFVTRQTLAELTANAARATRRA
jgi:predicted dinucleotide-binding enzyme